MKPSLSNRNRNRKHEEVAQRRVGDSRKFTTMWPLTINTRGTNESDMNAISKLHLAVKTHIKTIEMTGVLMRILSFSLVSWLGPNSPFFFVWAFNTTDAVLLSWCSLIKKDAAYSLLNIFWVCVGLVGMIRAMGFGPG